jgi:hypothetical protein
MPLGKLSKKQIQHAYVVLTHLQELVKTGASNSCFVDASNRFYTLIPHDFGIEKPPILNSEEMIKVSKICKPFSCGISKDVMCKFSIDQLVVQTVAQISCKAHLPSSKTCVFVTKSRLILGPISMFAGALFLVGKVIGE